MLRLRFASLSMTIGFAIAEESIVVLNVLKKTRSLAFATVKNLKFVAGVGWEEAGYVTQALS
jgi:hypothetical protein